MRFNSIRFKATFLYSAIMAVILIIFGGVVYVNLQNILLDDLDHELEMKSKEVITILDAYSMLQKQQTHPFQMLLRVLENEGIISNQKMIIDDLWRSKLEILRLKEDYINMLNRKGDTILYSNNLDKNMVELFAQHIPANFEKKYFSSFLKESKHLRAINMPIVYKNRDIVLQIATPMTRVIYVRHKMAVFLSVLVVFILIITIFLGRIFADRMLMPLNKVRKVAKHIVQNQDLSIRVEELKTHEEISDLVDALNAMLTKLQYSFQHISDFSSHVAHELKTPLAIIKGELELALDQDRSPEEYRRVLGDCLQELNRMIRVIKDLLLLAKLDYKRAIFNFETVNINELLNEVYTQMKVLAIEKGITLHVELPSKDVHLKADKVHLRRLFLNLVNNACQYTPGGGDICIKGVLKKDQFLIDVVDTGVGIAPEHLNKVFDKFFRIRRDDTGTGLGLNIAESIAKAHHGQIMVTSEINKGTTFTVVLPLS